MKFCPQCERVMVREASGDELMFRCTACGMTVKGDDWDAHIDGGLVGRSETAEMYTIPIRIAPFDRTTQQIMYNCPGEGCGRDYMSLVRVGADETAILTCPCGEKILAAKADWSGQHLPAAPPAGTAAQPAPAQPAAAQPAAAVAVK